MASNPDRLIEPSAALLRKLRVRDADIWAPLLTLHCGTHLINTPLRLAAFLANVLHETGNFTRLEEDLCYTTKRMMQVWPKRFPTVEATAGLARNPQALAERVYGGRMGNVHPGDGWKYRGRGLMQTTGRDNYARLGIATGRDLVTDPGWLLEPAGAVESAARFWTWAGCNPPADAGDIANVRRRVNGGAIGLADVAARRLTILDIMETIPNG